MLRLKFTWNDHFGGTTVANFAHGEMYNSRWEPSGSGVYVLNCLFNTITSTSNGGALYCSTSVTCLLIESTSFFTCKTSSGTGGAIYFSNTNGGQCVLHEVCSYDCCSTKTSSTGQFIFTSMGSSASSKNYVNYSSIVRCVNESLSAYGTLYLYNGNICCLSVNSSMNKCRTYSGIYCQPYCDLNYITCSFSYSSFADNSASEYICIRFYFGDAKYEIKSCNIIRNTQVSDSYGIIYASVNVTIEDFCILENSATYILYVSPSNTMTLMNCTIDTNSKNGSIIMRNTVSKSFILGLNHMSTRNCHSEYDSARYLTAIPYVSQPNKREFCYTCQGRVGVLFSLIQMFIFTFIHPNPSG
jgi:hypothetical protein